MQSIRFDSMILAAVMAFFPELQTEFGDAGWLWMKALVWQESSFNPDAVSHCGAQGLTQLMPKTAKQMGVEFPFNPEQNIEGGVRYLARQYRRLKEIPDPQERLKFALASYNGGRGYVNKALSLARPKFGAPRSYGMWVAKGCKPGGWQLWNNSGAYLYSSRCKVHGKTPDASQMVDYVAKIVAKNAKLRREYADHD